MANSRRCMANQVWSQSAYYIRCIQNIHLYCNFVDKQYAGKTRQVSYVGSIIDGTKATVEQQSYSSHIHKRFDSTSSNSGHWTFSQQMFYWLITLTSYPQCIEHQSNNTTTASYSCSDGPKLSKYQRWSLREYVCASVLHIISDNWTTLTWASNLIDSQSDCQSEKICPSVSNQLTLTPNVYVATLWSYCVATWMCDKQQRQSTRIGSGATNIHGWITIPNNYYKYANWRNISKTIPTISNVNDGKQKNNNDVTYS